MNWIIDRKEINLVNFLSYSYFNRMDLKLAYTPNVQHFMPATKLTKRPFGHAAMLLMAISYPVDQIYIP